MKRNFLLISIVLGAVATVTMGFSTSNGIDLSEYKTNGIELHYYVPNQDEIEAPVETTEETFQLFLGKTFVGFKEALAFKESRGSYSVINEFGYMGKYQFGKSTLQMIGIYNPETFMRDAKLQEDAFKANTSRNKWILRKDIKRYEGRYIGGVKVTESGILAAAHLAGAGNVIKFLRSGGTIGFQDAYGTSIRNYMKKFSGYDTSFIQPDKRAKVL